MEMYNTGQWKTYEKDIMHVITGPAIARKYNPLKLETHEICLEEILKDILNEIMKDEQSGM